MSDKGNDKKKDDENNKPEGEGRLQKSGKAAVNLSVLGAAGTAAWKAGQATYRMTGSKVLALGAGAVAGAGTGIGLSRGFKAVSGMFGSDDDQSNDNNNGKKPGGDNKPGNGQGPKPKK